MARETVGAGRYGIANATVDYSSTSLTTSAYIQLVASMPQFSRLIYPLFDSSGSALAIAFGAAGFEVVQFYVPPGGFPDPYQFFVPYQTRVSVKAVATPGVTYPIASGILLMSLLQ